MIRVLFVCLGNICRSPMAEGVFRDAVAQAGLADKISVDSAGTGHWHVGQHAHPGTLKVLEKHEIEYDRRARQFSRRDFQQFDYVLAMDHSNLADIQRMNSNGEDDTNITTFLHYANQAGTVHDTEVPDPYYNGSFDYVYELVSKGAAALLDHIRSQHDL